MERLTSWKRFAVACGVQAITSQRMARWGGAVADWTGRRGKVLEVFHCVTDPHSLLLLQALLSVIDRFDVALRLRVVREPAVEGLAAYRTSIEDQMRWRAGDAALLSELYADVLEPFDTSADVSERAADLGNELFALEFDGWLDREGLQRAIEANIMVFANDVAGLEAATTSAPLGTDPDVRFQENLEVLRSEGHYLSGMVHFGFEWFWGVDRVGILEEQLVELGLNKDPLDSEPFFTRTRRPALLAPPKSAGASLPDIVLFYSFRSPYSQLVLKPLFEMADLYGIGVSIRPVLPMVMRGLHVPWSKKIYIASDAVRVAHRIGWDDYGRLNDPVGKPTENAFAVYMRAKELGRERQFLLAWADHVYARGTDALSHEGLALICSDAGFEFDPALLEESAWREMAEANRVELTGKGFWGVPTVQFDDLVVWGQDRLVFIERAILTKL